MNNLLSIADKTAINLSFICAIHCLAFPMLAALLPTIMATHLEGEAFHLWMLIAVVPTSLIALSLGCKKHKQLKVLIIGTFGLTLLIAAAFLGHGLAGEPGEKALTVAGASIIALAHLLNHKLCRYLNCECHS